MMLLFQFAFVVATFIPSVKTTYNALSLGWLAGGVKGALFHNVMVLKSERLVGNGSV